MLIRSAKTRSIGSSFSAVLDIKNDNLPIVILVGIYICAGYLIQIFSDMPKIMTLHLMYTILFRIAIIFSAIFLIIQILRNKTWEYFNLNSIVGFLIVLFLSTPFKSTFASIKQVIPNIHDFCWDRDFMELDYVLHFGHHPWELLSSLLENEQLLRGIDFLYMLWFLMLLFFCLWMAWSNRRRLRLQFFISTLIVWMLLGSVLGTLFSSAGPCYYSKVVSESQNPYQPLMDSLTAMHESKPLWAVRNQIGLWNAKLANEWLAFGGISAMPSIHVAMAVVFALVAWRVNHWLGILLTAYALIVQIGSVILGWHYVIDGYVSAVLTIVLWKLVGKIRFAASDEAINQVDKKAELA